MEVRFDVPGPAAGVADAADPVAGLHSLAVLYPLLAQVTIVVAGAVAGVEKQGQPAGGVVGGGDGAADHGDDRQLGKGGKGVAVACQVAGSLDVYGVGTVPVVVGPGE